MKGLYKGKYLIAVYDKDDYLIEVACLPRELIKKCVSKYISRVAKGTIKSNHIYLIDCTEKHDDIFAEEDKLFLNFVKNNRHHTIAEEAKRLGVSVRTYCRHKSNGTLYKLKNKK